MRVAVYNCFPRQPLAETGLSKRVCLAARSLNWDAIEVESSVQVNDCKPDFVLALHFFTPKLTRYPTYGCMWSPPAFFQDHERYVRNIMSYDGYLCSSEDIGEWLSDLLYGTSKNYFIAPFYTSCHSIPYQAPSLHNARLLYAGTNWDGPRFRQLFEYLDRMPYVDIYGGKEAWRFLRRSYRGMLPFDGSSILSALNRAGVGLCLHKKEHFEAGTPSLRIFEIAASGAVAICQEHPFIRRTFGDSVLYLDPGLTPEETAEQINEHMQWIETHQDWALELSRKAYAIFADHYSLERLLAGIVPFHVELLAKKQLAGKENPTKRVQFIVSTKGCAQIALQNTLNSVADQIHSNVGVILLREDSSGAEAGTMWPRGLDVKTVPATSNRWASGLWEAFSSLTAEYFAVLQAGDTVYPEHVSTLLPLLQGTAAVAYSGSVEHGGAAVREPLIEQSTETCSLAGFSPRLRDKLLSLEPLPARGSFIAKTDLLDGIGADPGFRKAEWLFLLFKFAEKTDFAFSYQISSETAVDPEVNSRAWSKSLERLKTIFWKRGLAYSPPMETLSRQVDMKIAPVLDAVEWFKNSPFRAVLRKIRGRYRKRQNELQ